MINRHRMRVPRRRRLPNPRIESTQDETRRELEPYRIRMTRLRRLHRLKYPLYPFRQARLARARAHPEEPPPPTSPVLERLVRSFRRARGAGTVFTPLTEFRCAGFGSAGGLVRFCGGALDRRFVICLVVLVIITFLQWMSLARAPVPGVPAARCPTLQSRGLLDILPILRPNMLHQDLAIQMIRIEVEL